MDEQRHPMTGLLFDVMSERDIAATRCPDGVALDMPGVQMRRQYFYLRAPVAAIAVAGD